MPDFWSLLAIQAVAILSGVVTACLVLAIGGLGGIRALSRRLILAEERVEDTDQRITREVKRRAADAAVEARKASPKEQAEKFLAENPAPAARPGARPTIVGR